LVRTFLTNSNAVARLNGQVHRRRGYTNPSTTTRIQNASAKTTQQQQFLNRRIREKKRKFGPFPPQRKTNRIVVQQWRETRVESVKQRIRTELDSSVEHVNHERKRNGTRSESRYNNNKERIGTGFKLNKAKSDPDREWRKFESGSK
jgi:hypothetical protein